MTESEAKRVVTEAARLELSAHTEVVVDNAHGWAVNLTYRGARGEVLWQARILTPEQWQRLAAADIKPWTRNVPAGTS